MREFLGGAFSPQVAHAKAIACVNSPGRYAVVRHDDQRVVGLVSLTSRRSETELSYELLPDTWGQGLATKRARRFSGRMPRLATAVAESSQLPSEPISDRAELLDRLGMTVREEFAEYSAAQVLYATAPDRP